MMEEASIALMPNNVKKLAYNALELAERNRAIRDVITAILLYTWLLKTSSSLQDTADLQIGLGNAYQNLPTGDRADNLTHAIACFELALHVRTREAAPMQWAATQNNLGNAYADLPTGDCADNLTRAIACFEGALEVYTSMRVEYYIQLVSKNLEIARQQLRDLEQE